SRTSRQQIFHPFRALVTTMREQAVISHADSQASGKPPEKYGKRQSLPTEEEERGDGADVNQAEEKRDGPIQWLRKSAIVDDASHENRIPLVAGNDRNQFFFHCRSFGGRDGGGRGGLGHEPWQLDVPRQSQSAQSANAVPRDVEFVPGQTVTR